MTVGRGLKTFPEGSHALPDHYCQAISASITSNGRSLPCLTLYRYLKGEQNLPVSGERVGGALGLAALHLRFAEQVEADLRDFRATLDPPQPLEHPRAQKVLPTRAARADSENFLLTSGIENSDCRKALLLNPGQIRWLHGLSSTLIDSVLTWAPPVVSGTPGKSSLTVVGNWLSAWIACRLGLRNVPIRMTERPSRRPTVKMLDVVLLSRVLLPSLVNSNEGLIIKGATNLDDAVTLSGRSRSHCAEIRAAA